MAEAECDVAGAGRHVDQQELGVVPEHIGEELLERLVQHRTTPDDGLAVGDEVGDRDAADTPLLGRHDHLVDDGGRTIGAQHLRDRVAVDVGVDDTHRVALLGEGDGEVGGDARLADTTLARRDEEWAGLGSGRGERDRPTLGVTVGLSMAGGGAGRAVQLDPQVFALLVGHHREVELDVGDAVECGERAAHPILDLTAQRASGDGEGDQDVGGAGVVELRPSEHPEIDDRAVELRILDRSQRFDELVVRDCHAAIVARRSRVCTRIRAE